MGDKFQSARPDPREGVPTHGVGRAKGKGERMEKRFSNRKTGKLLAAAVGAAALAGVGASQADAALLIDVRATGATTSSAGVVDPKNVVINAPGDTVTLGIFASVTGTDGINNETLQSVYGLLNSVGAVKGNMSGTPSTLVAPFNGSGFQNGSVVDWDSDGDLDIGLGPTSSSSTGKFFARAASPEPMPSVGGSVQIGQIVFTATDTTSGVADVNFTIRNNNGNNVSQAALWFEDGNVVGKNPQTGPTGVGAPVNIAVPEPASLGLMALASVGLLGRRRK